MTRPTHFDPSVQGTIYALHAGDNVIRYIGLTAQDPDKYLKDHRRKARASKPDPVSGYRRPLHTWMLKHGVENIQITILDTPLISELNSTEIEYIEYYTSLGFKLVNSADGGSGRRGSHITAETREKIAATKRGIPRSADTIKAMSLGNMGKEPWNKGVPCSDDKKKALSLALKGKPSRGPHTRAHVNGGKPNPTCIFCIEDVRTTASTM